MSEAGEELRAIQPAVSIYGSARTPENHPDFYSRLTLNHIRSRAPQNEIMGNTASRRFLKEKPVFVTGSTSGIWDVSWQLNDYLKLENKLIYGRYHNERLHLPMTVSPQGVPAELKGRELQWEPVLHFSNKGRLKGLAGLHYSAANKTNG